MEFMKLMGHSGGECRASLAAMSRQVEGLRDCRMGHLVMTATRFDRGACFEQ